MLPIYEKIDFLLKLNNLKQNTMCEAIKVPTSTYSSMKQRNSKSISIDTIRDISNFFNISIDYFINNDIAKENYKKFLIINSDKIIQIQEIAQKYSLLNENYKIVVLNLINSLIEIQNKNNL